MKLQNLVVSGLMLGLVACSSGGGSGGGNGNAEVTQFKQDLRAAAKSVPALSAEQKQKFIQMFKNDASLLPSKNLYFDNYRDQNARSREYGTLNAEGRKLLSRVQNDCSISPGYETTSGQPALGQTVTREHVKSVNGNRCPLNYTEKTVSKETITNLDQQNRSGSSVGSMTMDASTQVLDPDLKSKIFSIGSDTHIEMQSQANNIKVDEYGKVISGTVYSSGNISIIEHTSRGEKIPGTGTAEILWQPNGTKVQMLINFKFPDGVVLSFGLFVENKTTEIIVNGESYTLESFYETYGTWFDIPDLEVAPKY